MDKPDEKIIEMIKQHNPFAVGLAETAAKLAMKKIHNFAPENNGVANLAYWLLVNFYTYDVVMKFVEASEELTE